VSKHDKRQEQVVRGLKVEVRNNDVGFALRKFKRKFKKTESCKNCVDVSF